MKGNNLFESQGIPLLVPDMPKFFELQPYLERIDESNIYTNFGPLVKELEIIFSENFGVDSRDVTTVSNATLGIEIVLQSLNLKKNAKILIPAFTFVATATAVIRAGFQPVLADVDLKTWILTPDIARSCLKKMHIDLVMPVATFGMPHDLSEWNIFEKETGIPVVIDAAAAYGAQWLKGCDGTLIFSLHATKSLPAGEGGVVVSTRPGLVDEVRERSNFGIYLNNKSSQNFGKLSSFGTNAKMSEYHAAVALASLKMWESGADKRRSLFSFYRAKIESASNGEISFQDGSHKIMAPTLMCIKLINSKKRDLLEKKFQEDRISTRRWYQAIIKDEKLMDSVVLPNTSILGDCLLGLPFFLSISNIQINRIERSIREIF